MNSKSVVLILSQDKIISVNLFETTASSRLVSKYVNVHTAQNIAYTLLIKHKVYSPVKIHILNLGIMTPFCMVNYKVVRVNAMTAFGEVGFSSFVFSPSNI